MLTEHALPHTKTNPSSGTVAAEVQGESTFNADGLNFAYDYYTTDKKLRLTLSAVQTIEGKQGNKVIRGLEMVFNSDIVSGTHSIKDGKFSATWWKMWANGDDTLFHTYNADDGSITLSFDHEQELYEGNFSFESKGPGPASAIIKSGSFSIEGRDNFTL
ncbi:MULTISPECIES: hypothetical protein [Pseudomonas]|uniref:hypothetical protein n=1 Tax=Pseudomonas TaxID=286 RepID=UPI000BA2C562|nr:MULTISPECIES: hypothetical protein [Pseudomonas]MDR9863017.1 hypothetical protein [Pseudomonas baetica]